MPASVSDISIRSEEVQEVLTAVPSWMIRWGNTLVFFIIIGLVAITWFVKYPDVISAEATITTAIPPQKEYAKTSGKIDTMLVVDNQKVLANALLAIVENTANFEDVYLLKAIVDTTVYRNHQFVFPTDQIPFLILGDIAADFAHFDNSYYLYMLNRQWQPFSNKAQANRQSLSELKNRLKNLESQQVLNAEELGFKNSELERQDTLFKQGLISTQEFENKQLENLQAKRIYKDRSLAISQTRQAINDAKLASKTTTINRNKEEQMLLRNVIQSFQQLKKSIRDWELKYVIKANIEGQVSFLDHWTENQTVNVGDLVFTIIPQSNIAYLAKLKTPSLNSGKIKINQLVNISLENYPSTEYGLLKGNIKKISSLTDQDGFYIVDVTLPTPLITNYGKEIIFQQEMRGRGEIVTEELRLMERFFYQFKEVFGE